MDIEAIVAATDDTLKELGIAAQGDLIALKHFAKRKSVAEIAEQSQSREHEREKRKAQLASFLSSPKSGNQLKSRLKKNSLQRTNKLENKKRRLEIGWLHQENAANGYVVVRAKDGGGTRVVDMPVKCRKNEIIKYAKKLFFPAANYFLTEDDVFCDLGSFKQEVIGPLVNFPDGSVQPFTLENYFQSTKLSKARLYLMTSKIEQLTDSGEDDKSELSPPSGQGKMDSFLLQPNDIFSKVPDHCPENIFAEGDEDQFSRSVFHPNASNSSTLSSTTTAKCAICTSYLEDGSELKCPENCDDKFHASCIDEWLKVEAVGMQCPTCNKIFHHTVLVTDMHPFTVPTSPQDGAKSLLPFTTPPHSMIPTASNSLISDRPTRVTRAPVRYSPADFNGSSQHSIRHESNDSMEETDDADNNEGNDRCLRIERVNVREEMIKAFMDKDISNCSVTVKMVDDFGQDEQGVDNGGIFREALSLFWGNIFDSCAVGEEERVPSLRHDLQQEQWLAVGRILTKGYIQANFFPVKLCKAFLISVLFGEEHVSNEILLDSFYKYISVDERDLVKKVLMGMEQGWDEDLQTDLLDFLERFKCRKLPTADNIESLILEIAHKEIVQCPQYVKDCWRDQCGALKTIPQFQNVSDVLEFYATVIPSTKKVLGLLTANPVNEQQRDSLAYLKRFVRGLDFRDLSLFLRFCTGGDVICVKKIEIEFVALQGLTRRPVAHTICGSYNLWLYKA